MSRLAVLLAMLLLVLMGAAVAVAQDTTGTPPPVEPAPDPPSEPEVPLPQPEPVPQPPAPEPAPPVVSQEAPPPSEITPPAAPPDTTAPPSRVTAPPSQLVEPDTLALPVGPVAAAIARIRAAVADSTNLTPEGALPPMPSPLRGVVWEPPDSLHNALDELLAIRQAGVRVIRTSVIADTMVLRTGDLLGLSFYQDLPIANLPAPVLLDTLGYAIRLLNDALTRAQPFASARHFGLTLFSDTSDPRMRPYVEQLAALARERGAQGTQVYYLTRFPENDRAAHLVDFVLLDARDTDPSALLARWRAQREEPAGIGAFGAAVRPGREGGWRTPGTLAAQARTLENGLRGILSLDNAPVALFVYRWQDGRTDAALDQRAEVQGVGFGLREEDGTARLGLDVVQGFFTGTQRVFAFDAGAPAVAVRTAAPLVLLGWVIVLGLGLLYGLVPRFGMLASRYWGRHDLYRESIQRGYDLNAGLNAALAVALALAAGLIGASALRGLGRTDALATATSGWAAESQARLTSLLGEPVLLLALVALLYGLWVLLNMLWLYALAGRRYRIRAQQALTLAVWSRWTVFALMVGAMILATVESRTATNLVPLLLGLALMAEIVATGRMLVDFGSIAKVPVQRSILLGLGVPMGLMAAGLLVLFIIGRAELGFLWHLATRS